MAPHTLVRTGSTAMAYRLILAMGLLTLLGLGSDRLVEQRLESVGSISLPARLTPVGRGEPWDDDSSRLYFRFAREYGWLASLGSSTAYRQILCVSLFAPDAVAADYERWPPRFEPLYSKLTRERTLTLGFARLTISSGRYAQNALDEPAHVYVYSDPSHRLQIAWHVVDADVAPEDAIALLPRMAASFQLRTDPRGKFADMRGRGAREQDREGAAIRLARETLVKAGFGAAAPGKPVFARGVYVEWMDDPEPRFQLVKPLGLVPIVGPNVPTPHRLNHDGRTRAQRGSIGWRTWVDGAWLSDNRDNAYLPLPGIERALTQWQSQSTTLYYYATTVRVAVADEDEIAVLGAFFEELSEIERAWQQGTLVQGERIALPESLAPKTSNTSGENTTASPEPVPAASTPCERFCFGIDLQTGTSHLDALRRRLAAAAQDALPDVSAGRFDAAEAAVLAVDREIQSAVMLGAMYTTLLREAVQNGARESRAEYVTALHERALHWRLSAYPEAHTAYEADDYAAGRAADRAELAALIAESPSRG